MTFQRNDISLTCYIHEISKIWPTYEYVKKIEFFIIYNIYVISIYIFLVKGSLKGVFAKTERGYRLNAIKKKDYIYI